MAGRDSEERRHDRSGSSSSFSFSSSSRYQGEDSDPYPILLEDSPVPEQKEVENREIVIAKEPSLKKRGYYRDENERRRSSSRRKHDRHRDTHERRRKHKRHHTERKRRRHDRHNDRSTIEEELSPTGLALAVLDTTKEMTENRESREAVGDSEASLQFRRRQGRSSSGRSFASVSRGMEALLSATPKNASTLLLDDGSAEDGDTWNIKQLKSIIHTHSNEKEKPLSQLDAREVDFVRCAIQFQKTHTCPINLLVQEKDIDDSISTTSVEYARKLLERQGEMNLRTKKNSRDVQAWIELAHLSHSSLTQALGEKKAKQTGRRHQATPPRDLERTRDILATSLQHNAMNLELNTSFLTCMHQLHQLGRIDEDDVQQAYESAISNFKEVDHDNDDPSSLDNHIRQPSQEGKYASWNNTGSTRPSMGRGRGVNKKPAWMSAGPSNPNDMQSGVLGSGRGVSNLPAWMTLSYKPDENSQLENPDDEKKSSNLPKKKMGEFLNAPSRAKSLLYIYRMKLRRLPQTFGFNAERVRSEVREALESLSEVYKHQNIGPEVAFLFLDYIRMEETMGYSERALGLIQAALEVALRPLSDTFNIPHEDRQTSFQKFWESEAPRIGDEYPGAGWTSWQHSRKEEKDMFIEKIHAKEIRGKKKRRLKASDFFDDTVMKASAMNATEAKGTAETVLKSAENSLQQKMKQSKLLDAYQSAVSQLALQNKSTQYVKEDTMNNTTDRRLDAIRAHANVQALKDLTPTLDGNETHSSKERDRSADKNFELKLEELVNDGKVVSDTALEDDPDKISVYSFVHNRRIEISKTELSSDKTRDIFRRALRNLIQKKGKGDSEASILKKKKGIDSRTTCSKLYIVEENDPFLAWGAKECSFHSSFSPPLRYSSTDAERVQEDPNTTVLFEDIEDIIYPYFSKLNPTHGVPALVMVCLEFLGVSFPRATSIDEFDKDSYVLASNGGGGECFEDVGMPGYCLPAWFDGIFSSRRLADRSRPEFNWSFIQKQIAIDESVVVLDQDLFKEGNVDKLQFIRNTLHGMVFALEGIAKTPMDTIGNFWSSFLTVALIEFEGNAATGNGDKVKEISMGLLQGTEAARHDPRIWVAYAQVESINMFATPATISRKKPVDPGLKILSGALDATGGSKLSGIHAEGWMDLSLNLVRKMLDIDFKVRSFVHDEDDISKSSSKISEQNITTSAVMRDRALHVLCCMVESRYTPLPKQRRKKDTTPAMQTKLVSSSRLLKCRSTLRTYLSMLSNTDLEVSHKSADQARFFDPSPIYYHYGVVAAWLEVVGQSSSDVLNFQVGIAIIEEWSEAVSFPVRATDISISRKRCLSRWANVKLELAILSTRHNSSLHEDLHFSLLKNTLIPTVLLLKSQGCIPSQSILMALAYTEHHCAFRIPSPHGYASLRQIQPALASQIIFRIVQAVLFAESTSTQTHNSPAAPACCFWTRDGCERVREAIINSIESSSSVSYPSLWHALIRLDILGQSRFYDRPNNLAQTLSAARNEYERGLPKCLHSKRLWLDAFTVLRPVFSEESALEKVSAMEEADIRLVKGFEDISFS